jgi:hypothetical protein
MINYFILFIYMTLNEYILNYKKTINELNNIYDSSRINLYKVPIGTELFHESLNNNSFNPNNIRIGDDTLIAYFTLSPNLKANGYIHKFKVKNDINNILIVSRSDTNANWSKEYLDKHICNSKYDGIAFLFPNSNEIQISLCNPNKYLEYVSTKNLSSLFII